jgi:O-antigen ligase
MGGSPRRLPPTSALDIAGVVLGAATATWFLLSAAVQGSDASRGIALLVVAATSFAGAIVLSRVLTPLLPASLVVLGAGAALFLASGPRGPLGYENANGIFFVLAAAAALSLWAAAPRNVFGIAALAVGILFGAIPIFTEVLAATLAFGLVVVIAVTVHFGRLREAVAASAAIFLVVLLGTIVLGLTYSGGTTRLSAALTERRLELWHDALAIAGDHPFTGAGFDQFERLSPTARSDRDARWAHHEFLQVAAETGIPGLILVVSLFLWGFVRLYVAAPSSGRALAAAGIAAAGIAASVDYVFHFAAVPIATAALLGAGVASEPKPRRS